MYVIAALVPYPSYSRSRTPTHEWQADRAGEVERRRDGEKQRDRDRKTERDRDVK